MKRKQKKIVFQMCTRTHNKKFGKKVFGWENKETTKDKEKIFF